jgi:hypothetical protein
VCWCVFSLVHLVAQVELRRRICPMKLGQVVQQDAQIRRKNLEVVLEMASLT